MGRYTAGGTGRDILAGAIAGAAAVWVMDKLDWKLYRARGPEGMRRTEAARPGGMDPAHVMADKLGVNFGDKKDNPAGHAIHYGVGVGMGALYGLLRSLSPAFASSRGAMFGIAMWVIEDEGLNTIMGTAGPPLAYPWQDHVRGAATHTVFGVVTDLITRILAPWRDRVVIEQGPPISERLATARDAVQRLPVKERLADARDVAQRLPVRERLADARDAAGRLQSQAASKVRAYAR